MKSVCKVIFNNIVNLFRMKNHIDRYSSIKAKYRYDEMRAIQRSKFRVLETKLIELPVCVVVISPESFVRVFTCARSNAAYESRVKWSSVHTTTKTRDVTQPVCICNFAMHPRLYDRQRINVPYVTLCPSECLPPL